MLWANRTTAADCVDLTGAGKQWVQRLYSEWEAEIDGLSPHAKELAYLRAAIRCRREWTLPQQWKLQKLLAVDEAGPEPSAQFAIRCSESITSLNREIQSDDRLLLDCAKQQQPSAGEASGGHLPAEVTINVGPAEPGDAPISRPSEGDE